ncbi:HNH endonuclease [Chitinophaga cymbidii]|uniref:HNH domain-containing protein n=1 Tax=Chitinophaga cymbidii TaxID=1096750 RepID=A0A512RR22_9BACT|nr:HNH endonuclease [Chitinophaga cymbidii]GEP98116.1 hypothetical protein CCY01nite_43760 [Chitinophaga cymbidii]
MFKATDIHWVKNVKRNGGTDWAYYENADDTTIHLNFSDDQRKGAALVSPGEIILLFQRVDNLPGVPKRTYLTHLVTPIDSVLYKDSNSNHRFQYIRNVAIIARAEPRTAISTIPKELNFYKPQWGKVCDIQLLNSLKPRYSIQQDVWTYFSQYLNPNLGSLLDQVEIPEELIDEDISVKEGSERIILLQHLSRERNKMIVGLAKSRALRQGAGYIQCECCGFDFARRYGSHGSKFIECHHGIPIASGGERMTKIEDLHMVCSNCHRMLHRKTDQGVYLSIQELKTLLHLI